MSPRLLHRLPVHSLLLLGPPRLPQRLPRRRERLIGFPVGRCGLRPTRIFADAISLPDGRGRAPDFLIGPSRGIGLLISPTPRYRESSGRARGYDCG
jgi:hypothetical protein